ncbi:hypothetical protein Hoch_2733 [Haliangium ochraceum DSM 14365]|uniref:Uncharacterized protein n=1 Tax=Haliangium ochraceum (strain DSM 14365 / JCM 11303 / SMP-2) TaxID=502025 RepID=D0LN85_HALO1|nr:hypothetical protein Hoch_2733 [Haliangium ochraceum DSM 14365]
MNVCDRDGYWPKKPDSGGTREYWMYRGGPFAVDAGEPR